MEKTDHKFRFPCRIEDIFACFDVEKLKEWQVKFSEELTLAEHVYGEDFVGAGKLQKYLQANAANERHIDKRIKFLSRPVTPIEALRAFHDVAMGIMDEDLYIEIVDETLKKLGRPDLEFPSIILKH